MAWDLVVASGQASGSNNNDISVNIGTGTGRKAILFIGALDDGAATPSTAVYDPAGTNVAMTAIRNEDILNSGDAFYMLDAYYIDIPDGQSGTKVFRGIQTGGFGSIAGVVVYENTPSGAPEASDPFESAAPATSVSNQITTVSAGAKIISAVFAQGGASPFFTPTTGQTERVDVDQDDYLNLAIGDLTGGAAGAHTLTWTSASSEVQIQIDVAWPASGGGGGDESKSGTDSFTFTEGSSLSTDSGDESKSSSDSFSFDEGAEALTDLTFEDFDFDESSTLAASFARTESFAPNETAAIAASSDRSDSFSFSESSSVSTSGGDASLSRSDSFVFSENAQILKPAPPSVGGRRRGYWFLSRFN